jgi:RND family efflux transporter MFP subunit
MRIAKIAGIAAVAAVAGALFIFRGGPSQPVQQAREEKPKEPVQVRLIAATLENLPRVVKATGALAAEEEVTAAFKVPGRILEITADLGSPVRKGQILSSLDASDFRLRVEQAEASVNQVRAQLGLAPGGTDDQVDSEQTSLVRETRALVENARLNRQRLSSLVEKGFVARAEVDDATSQVLVAESRYQSALEEIRNRQAVLVERRLALALSRQQLADAVLVSPIDGTVLERKASVGEFVSAGAPIFRLVRVDPLRLRVAVTERDAAALRVGQAVRVSVEGDSGIHSGRIARMSPSIAEQNRTLSIEAEIANPDGRLRPGAFAQAEILIEGGHPSLLIPASSLVTFAGLEKVLTVKEDKVAELKVRSGQRLGDRIEIVEGLPPGVSVISEPGNLTGGQPVAVKR